MEGAAHHVNDLIVIVTPPGAATPVTIGSVDGVVPQGFTCSVDQHGPTSAGFTLARDTNRTWPDIQAGSPIDVTVGGTPIWSGRLTGAPAGGPNQLSVTAEGWQYHLDDDQQLYGGVSGSQLDAFPQKTADQAANTAYIQGGLTDIGQNIVVGFPQGTVIPAGGRVGVTWDAGEGRVFAACSLDWAIGNAVAGLQLNVNAHALPYQPAGANSAGTWNGTVMNTVGASGTVTSTFGTAYRYVTLLINCPAGLTATSHHYIRVTGARFAAVSSYLSGGASVLKASNVVATALLQAPLLDQSTAGIEATSFNIPDFWPKDYTTARELIDGVNAYHGYDWLVTVDRRLTFAPQATSPTLQIGSWSGGRFIDQSTASLNDIANKVIVEYTNAAGVESKTVRTSASSVLTVLGLTRAKRLATGLRLSTSAANAIGDVWLALHATPKMAGSFTATSDSVREITGGSVPPHHMLRRVNELVRVDSPNPVTGEPTRDGRIVGVTYTHDTKTAEVSLDNNTTNLEAFLARLQVVGGRQ